MKVVHLITGLQIGGAEIMLRSLLATPAMQTITNQVWYFHPGPVAERLITLGVQTRRIRGLVSPYDPLGWFRLYVLLRREQPDLIHTALWSANFMGRMMGRLLGIPVISDLHSDVVHHGLVRNTIDYATASCATTYIAVATAVKDSFVAVTHCTQPVIVIPNGIEPLPTPTAMQQLQLRAQLGIDPGAFVVGSVGRLVAIKNYPLLIDAFAQFAATIAATPAMARLCIIGSGPEHKSLMAYAQHRGMASFVVMPGERADARLLMHLFDCYASTSQSEGMSRALLEALSAGCPIVATSPTLTHEVIRPGIHGLLVSLNDYQTISKAFLQLYQSPELRQSMSIANKEYANSQFDIDAVGEAYQKLYLSYAKFQIKNLN